MSIFQCLHGFGQTQETPDPGVEFKVKVVSVPTLEGCCCSSSSGFLRFLGEGVGGGGSGKTKWVSDEPCGCQMGEKQEMGDQMGSRVGSTVTLTLSMEDAHACSRGDSFFAAVSVASFKGGGLMIST